MHFRSARAGRLFLFSFNFEGMLERRLSRQSGPAQGKGRSFCLLLASMAC